MLLHKLVKNAVNVGNGHCHLNVGQCLLYIITLHSLNGLLKILLLGACKLSYASCRKNALVCRTFCIKGTRLADNALLYHVSKFGHSLCSLFGVLRLHGNRKLLAHLFLVKLNKIS